MNQAMLLRFSSTCPVAEVEAASIGLLLLPLAWVALSAPGRRPAGLEAPGLLGVAFGPDEAFAVAKHV